MMPGAGLTFCQAQSSQGWLKETCAPAQMGAGPNIDSGRAPPAQGSDEALVAGGDVRQ